jgi:hypothetical protein
MIRIFKKKPIISLITFERQMSFYIFSDIRRHFGKLIIDNTFAQAIDFFSPYFFTKTPLIFT